MFCLLGCYQSIKENSIVKASNNYMKNSTKDKNKKSHNQYLIIFKLTDFSIDQINRYHWHFQVSQQYRQITGFGTSFLDKSSVHLEKLSK